LPAPLYPVNPKRPTVLGLKAYPSIKEVPAKPDLAVIITPPATVPGIVKDCVDRRRPGAIIISAGFKEIGASGVELERQVMEEANAAACASSARTAWG
jgi:acetyltransferase